MVLLGLVAPKHSGKNLAAKALPDYRTMAFADPLKQALMAMFGFTHEQMYGPLRDCKDPGLGIRPREMMQVLGTDIVRDELPKRFPDLPNLWIRRFRQMYNPNIDTVVTDVRFLDEADTIRALGGFLIRIKRPGLQQDDTHESEIEGLKIQCKYEIINNDTEETLQRNIRNIVELEIKMTRNAEQ